MILFGGAEKWPGRNVNIPIEISTESNSFFGQQKKRFSGINVEHKFNDNFIIGGAFGSSEEIIQKSQLTLSASDLTFPHKLFKIFLMEQIFRASAINRNHPYHK